MFPSETFSKEANILLLLFNIYKLLINAPRTFILRGNIPDNDKLYFLAFSDNTVIKIFKVNIGTSLFFKGTDFVGNISDDMVL
jgi:hypothetical protein